MKKKIQKYLSGEREGFSLVELIIVIAILAILIGVVALVVLPYLESARESTDRSALAEVTTAFKTAVSNPEYAKKAPTSSTKTGSLNADLKKKIESYLEKDLATTLAGLSSKNITSATSPDFYFNTTAKGYIVSICDGSGNVLTDSDGKAFTNEITTPASE